MSLNQLSVGVKQDKPWANYNCNSMDSKILLTEQLTATGLTTVNDLTILGTTNGLSPASFTDISCQNINVSNMATVGAALRFSAGPVAPGDVMTASNISGDAKWSAPPAIPVRQVEFTPYVVDLTGSTPGAFITIQGAMNAVASDFPSTNQVILVKNVGIYSENLVLPASCDCSIVGVCEPGYSGDVVLSGSHVLSNQGHLSFENFTMSGDGLSPIFTVGSAIDNPTLTLRGCSLFDNANANIFVGQNTAVIAENCSFVATNSDTISSTNCDNSSLTLRNSTVLSSGGAGIAIALNAPASSSTLTAVGCSSIMALNAYAINLLGFMTADISDCTLASPLTECVYVDVACILNTHFNAYNSAAVSTLVVTGGVGGTVNFFADYATGTNTSYDGVNLVVNPLIAIS